MRKWIWTLLTSGTIAIAAVGVAACGDDSTGGNGTSDGGKGDGSIVPLVDGGKPNPGTDSGTPLPDGGGACDFASYVIGLTKQPGTSAPDPTLGSACKDTASTTTQADFASLFP